MRRSFLLLFAFYVLTDLACPFVPGAFAFEVTECVDGVSAPRARTISTADLATWPEVLVARIADATDTPPLPHASRGTTWRPHVARDHAVATDGAAPSPDDH
jgi:hypothetical protein